MAETTVSAVSGMYVGAGHTATALAIGASRLTAWLVPSGVSCQAAAVRAAASVVTNRAVVLAVGGFIRWPPHGDGPAAPARRSVRPIRVRPAANCSGDRQCG